MVPTGADEPQSLVTADGLPVTVLLGSFDVREPADVRGLHGTVRAFRAGDPAAVATILGAARHLVAGDTWQGPSRLAVPVPAHDGSVGASLEVLADVLATSGGWSISRAPVIRRASTIPEAKLRGARDSRLEAASLRVDVEAVPPGTGTLVLVDDVLASGDTLRATAAALRLAGWDGAIEAVVVARAV